MTSCVIALSSCASIAADALTTDISDKNLKACIEKIANKKKWTRPDQFVEITCHNKNISSLEGIEQFSQITKLSLHKNNLSSFNASQLLKLRSLNLGRNKLREITLTGLADLEELYLFGNQLTKVSLSSLPKLKILKSNSNEIVAFTYNGLPALAKVYMFDNAMEDIDFQSLPSLQYMDVRQNPMPDELYERMDKMRGTTILHDGNADDWD